MKAFSTEFVVIVPSQSETGDINECLREQMFNNESGISRRRVLGSIGTVGSLTVAGCSANAKTPSGENLRCSTLYPPITLDPIKAAHIGSKQVIGQIFEGLYVYNTDTTLRPQLAAEAPSIEKDGSQVLVTLKEQPRFQNGESVTAKDVKYSFEAPVTEETAPQWQVDMIESIETVNDRRVRFHLEDPYPAFKHSLTLPIVPRDAREANKEKFGYEPIGSGPFEIRKFSEEKKAQVVRWDDYWGSPSPEIASFTSAYVESPIVRLSGLKTNRTDLMTPVSPLLWNQTKRTNGVSIAARDGYTSYYIGFNLNEGPTTEKPVREAIGYCIDLDEIVSDFIRDAGDPQTSILPTEVAKQWDMPLEEWGSIPNRKNTEKAKRLFREADAASGQFRILTSKDPQWEAIAEAIAGGLRNAGHGALVKSVSWKQYLKKFLTGSKKDYSIFIGGVSGHPDPDSFLYPTFHENNQGTTNGIFYNKESVMRQISRARQTTDESARQRLYRAALTTLLEDRAYLPICSFKNSYGVDRTVRNFHVHPIAERNPQLANENAVVRIDNE